MSLKKHPITVQIIYTFARLPNTPFYDISTRVYRLVIRQGKYKYIDTEYESQSTALQEASNYLSDIDLFMPKAENQFSNV